MKSSINQFYNFFLDNAYHIPGFIRGVIWQIIHFKYFGILILGRGARIIGSKNIKIRGAIKLDDFALVDATNCKELKIGDGFALGRFSVLRCSGSRSFISEKVNIGSKVTFGPFCNIGGGFGLYIGDDCTFGPYVSIHPESHNYNNLDIPIHAQGIRGNGIKILGNSWIGSKSSILDNVTIEQGCIIGGSAVLTSARYKRNSIIVGVPAKVVSSR